MTRKKGDFAIGELIPDHRVPRKRTRIQARNEQRILDAAQEVFADYGFHGATIDKVAGKADMSQPNLHHYFKRKSDLYDAVLVRTLEIWLRPLQDLNPDGEPEIELARYIAQKIDLSRQYPQASRIFANEILRGAPILSHYLKNGLKPQFEKMAAAIQHWTDSGKIAAIDPYHLIFMIWASTQHYTDFLPQITAVMGIKRFTKAHYGAAERSICDIILRGVLTSRGINS